VLLYILIDYGFIHAFCAFSVLHGTFEGNSLDKLRHTRSVAYSVELVLLNKHQILGVTRLSDRVQNAILSLT